MPSLSHLTGRPEVVDDDTLATMAATKTWQPYPLGIPRRVLDKVQKTLDDFAQSVDEMLGTGKVHEVTNLMPSDVPGVLVAAGLEEILASLGRIQRAMGFEASERAYYAILRRALADGRDDLARQMTSVREQLTRARQQEQKRDPASVPYRPPSSTPVRDLMQQKADEAQREAEENAAKRAAFNASREQAQAVALAEYQKASQQIGGLQGAIGYRGTTNYGQH